MKVLVACEESQRVCISFRQKGHEAYSCDILPCSGGHPEWHIQDDVLKIINGNCEFVTVDGTYHNIEKWNLLIAHPPCTYLTVSANKYYDITKYGEKAKKRYIDRYKAIVFFLQMCLAHVEKICVENPVGIMSTAYCKPTQIIQPYYFGDEARKATCLWLKNLPPLKTTNIVGMGEILPGGYSVGAYAHGPMSWNKPELSKLRSKTFWGVAHAMAEQWG